jgi:hypothetical protein
MSRTGKSTSTESRFGCQGWGRRKWGVTAGGCGVSFVDDETALSLTVNTLKPGTAH